MKKHLSLLAFIIISLVSHAVDVKNLRCESQVVPLGIDNLNPQLSWLITESNDLSKVTRDQRQTAYQILVATSEKILASNNGDLWDSGKVDSDQCVGVVYSGKPLKSSLRCYWKVRVWDKRGKPSPWSSPSQWRMGLLNPTDWKAQWITASPELFQIDADKNFLPALWFRKEFSLADKPGLAVITVHSPNYFELYVNGIKAGADILTPAVSDIQKQTYTICYDVSKLLRSGTNCIGLWMGNGWANNIALRVQLDALVADNPYTIGTDTTWKCRISSLSRIGKYSWNNFGGELLDSREYISDWNLPGSNDKDWKLVVPTILSSDQISSQINPLNRIGEKIRAAAVTPLSQGRYEIDFGRNLTGWLNFHFDQLTVGQKIRFYFADRIFPDGTQKSPIGNIGVQMQSCVSFPRLDGGKNVYQCFNQISEFISAGRSEEVFENKFNYAGFRYVVVEGLSQAPKQEDATALLVESNLEPAGSFECSDSLLNRIHAINRWTQRCLNLGGYYVDCPHRERMGYGDGQVALQGMMMNFDADNFYKKWVQDWSQALEKKKLSFIAPHFNDTGGGPPWPGTIARIPWQHYLHYGDPKVIEDHIEAARQYCEYLDGRATNDVLHSWGGGFSFIGDWVPPGRGMDTNNWPNQQMAEFFCNCYRVHLWQLVEKMAVALGRLNEADYARKRAASISTSVHTAFFDSINKRYVIDEQIYYAFPLFLGITPESERQAVLDNLLRCITVKNKGHLDTGMLGTMLLMEYLNQIGRDDLVLGIYQKKDYPGWGYMVEQGATTMWEQWNGYWSQIHSCFTSADNWLYEGLAGIQPDPAQPGFKNVIIKPAVVGDITWVKAYHDSPYGRIVCNWKRDGKKLVMDIIVPVNSKATVFIPGKNGGIRKVGSGIYQFKSLME